MSYQHPNLGSSDRDNYAVSIVMSEIVAIVVAVLFFILVITITLLIARVSKCRDVVTGGGGGAKHKRNRFLKSVIKYSKSVPESFDFGLFEIAPGNVSLYSSLLPWHIADVNAALRNEFPDIPPGTITDATSHIGMDSTNFLKVFPTSTVTAVELDPNIAKILKRNGNVATKQLKLPKSSFRAVNAEASDWIKNHDVDDLVFFDPPWEAPGGGTHAMMLGETPMADLVSTCLDRGAKVVIVKLSSGANLDALDNAVGRTAVRYPIKNAKNSNRPRPSFWLMAYRQN